MDSRTAALQLAANKKAEMAQELTIELHLAAFALAITILLGSKSPKLQDSEKCLAGLAAKGVIDIIYSTKHQPGGNYSIYEAGLSWGLIIFMKHLNSLKGYNFKISHPSKATLSDTGIPARGLFCRKELDTL